MSNEEKTVPANEKLVGMIATLFEPMPNPVIHGDFNRLMFLEAMLVQAGIGISITAEDIMKYAGITVKEFPIIKDEYIKAGILLEEKNMYDIVMYSLNQTVKKEVEAQVQESHKKEVEKLKALKEAATPKEGRLDRPS